MTHFRKRLGADVIQQVNDWVLEARHDEPNHDRDKSDPPVSDQISMAAPTV